MSIISLKEIEFLSALQSFTVHCVANQSLSKRKSYCYRLLCAVKHLSELYIGHKIQIALALQSASQRNEKRLILNENMNILSHLIQLCRPNLNIKEEEKCQQWTGIDLNAILDQCEDCFKKQSYSSTLWIQILNNSSMLSTHINLFQNNLFYFVQHDTDIEQLFQWMNENKIEIPGRFNRTYGGIPLFWCTPSSSSSSLESKYGSIRLTFPFSCIYSSIQHHLFNLGSRKNGNDIWHNILITTRKYIAGYGNDFAELSSIPSSPLDIAIDLTDGPLILSDVEITFVNHTRRCIPLLPDKLTTQHSCYHTSNSAMYSFVRYLRKKEQFTLNQVKHLFNLQIFEKLKEIDNILSDEDINILQCQKKLHISSDIIYEEINNSCKDC